MRVLATITLLVSILGGGLAHGGAVEVLDAARLRLEGQLYRLADIDAPDPDQRCWQGVRLYPCGTVAIGGLMDLTAGAVVRCTAQVGAPPDPDGARVARCYADGYELSEGMVYTGWALAAREGSGRLSALEADARRAGRGLWRGRFVVPWEWRAGKRLPEEAAGD